MVIPSSKDDCHVIVKKRYFNKSPFHPLGQNVTSEILLGSHKACIITSLQIVCLLPVFREMCITFKLQDSKRDFRPSNDPMARIKIPNSYGTSTRHTQAYRRVSFVSSEKCRKSSSDKSYMAENVIVRPSYDPLVPN